MLKGYMARVSLGTPAISVKFADQANISVYYFMSRWNVTLTHN